MIELKTIPEMGIDMQSKGSVVVKTAVKAASLGALFGAVIGIIISNVNGALVGAVVGAAGIAISAVLLGRPVIPKRSRLLWLAVGLATAGVMIGAAISTGVHFSGAGSASAGMVAVTLGFSLTGAVGLGGVFLILGVLVGLVRAG